MKRSLFGLILFLSSFAFANGEAPPSFTYEGRLYDTSNNPLAESVTFRLQIFNEAKNCLLYEETQVKDLTATDGVFAISVGTPTGDAKRSGNDPNFSMWQVFKNIGTLSGIPAAECAATTYTPALAETRVLRVHITPSSTGVPETLSPDQTMNSVPTAVMSESLQGIGSDGFVQITGSVTQPIMEALAAGTSPLYLKAGDDAQFGDGVNYTNNGQIAIGTSTPDANAEFEIENNAPTVRLEANAASGGDISIDFNSGANPQARIYSTEGTQELHMATGNPLVDALIIDNAQNATFMSTLQSSTLAINPSGGTGGEIQLRDDDGTTNYVALKAPTALGADVTWTLPATDGANGEVLTTNGAGTLSWSPGGGGGGDVTGPGASTDNAVARFDSTTGKLIQNSGVVISDTNDVTGVVDLTATGDVQTAMLNVDGTTCLNTNGDQIFHDTNCDGTQDAGEEFIDAVDSNLSVGAANQIPYTNGGATDLAYSANFIFDGSTVSIDAATTTDEALVLQTTDDNATNNILEVQNSAGTAIYTIGGDGAIDSATDLTDKDYVDTAITGAGGSYVQVAGDTMTGALDIQGSADAVQLAAQANGTQTGNVFEVRDSGGNMRSGINDDGSMTIDLPSGSTDKAYIDAKINGSNDIFFGQDSSGAGRSMIMLRNAGDKFRIYPNGAVGSGNESFEVSGDGAVTVGKSNLNAQFRGGALWNWGEIDLSTIDGLQTVTIADSGNGSRATDTSALANNKYKINIDCQDADGCDWTIDLTGYEQDRLFVLINISANPVYIQPVAGDVITPAGVEYQIEPRRSTWVYANNAPDNAYTIMGSRNIDPSAFGDLKSDGTVAMAADFDFNSNKGINLAAPTAGGDAVNKTYADANLLGQTLPAAPGVGQDQQVLKWNNGTSQWIFANDDNASVSIGAANQIPYTNGGATDLAYSANFVFDGSTVSIDAATTTDEGLILQTTDDNNTNNIFEVQNAAGTAIATIGGDGAVDSATDLATKNYVDTNDSVLSVGAANQVPFTNGGATDLAYSANITFDGNDLRVGAGTFDNGSGGQDVYVTNNLEVDGNIYGDGNNVTNIDGGNVVTTATGNIAATDADAAIAELEAEKVSLAGDTMTGHLELDNQQELRLHDAAGTEYTALRANATVGTSHTYTLPAAPSAGQYLTTNASGDLSWGTPGGAGDVTDVNAGTGIAVTSPTGPAPTVALDYTATLAGDPALATGQSSFATTGVLFEGATADTNEALLTVTDPTADRTWTLPDASGTVAVSATAPVAVSAAGDISVSQNAGTDITADLEEEAQIGTTDITGNASAATGQVLVSTGANAATWGALDLADSDAVTNELPDANVVDDLTIATTKAVSVAPSAAEGITLRNFGTSAGETTELRFEETNNTNNRYVALKAPDTLAANITLTLPIDIQNGQYLTTDASGNLSWSTPGGAGDVTGPGSSTDNAIARFDSTTGKVIQNSGVIVSDTDDITGVAGFTSTGDMDVDSNTLFVDASTNRVGVGTNTPAYDVQVLSGADYVALDPANNKIRMFRSGQLDGQITAEAGYFDFNQAIDSAGHIIANGALASGVQHGGTGSGTLTLAPASGGAPYIHFMEDSVANRGNLGFAASSGDLVYEAGGASLGAGTEVFRIAADGDVGIGSNAPAATLHVDGDADQIQLRVDAHASQTAGSDIFEIRNAAGAVVGTFREDGVATASTDLTTRGDVTTLIDNSGTFVEVAGDTMTGDLEFSGAQKIIGGTSTTADLTLQTTSGVGATGADMHFLVGNNGATEAMTILNNGNVGVGETSPGHTLSVYKQRTATTGVVYGTESKVDLEPSANQTTGSTTASYSYVDVPGSNTNTVRDMNGVYSLAINNGTGTVNGSIAGVNAWAGNTANTSVTGGLWGTSSTSDSSNGNISTSGGGYFGSGSWGGTVTNQYGILVGSDIAGATVTNRYGLRINALSGSATNDYAIYSAATQDSFFTGDVIAGGGTFDNASGSADIYVTGNLEVDGTIYGDGSGITGVTAVPSGVAGSIQFSNGTTTDSDNANLFWDDAADELGIGTAAPSNQVHVSGANATIRIQDDDSATAYTTIDDAAANQLNISKINNSGQALIDLNPIASDNTSETLVRIFRQTDTSGNKAVQFMKGDNTATIDAQIGVDGAHTYFNGGGDVGIGTTSPNAKFDLVGNMQITGEYGFQFSADATGNNGYINFLDSGSSHKWHMYARGTDHATQADQFGISYTPDNTNWHSYMTFTPNNAADSTPGDVTFAGDVTVSGTLSGDGSGLTGVTATPSGIAGSVQFSNGTTTDSDNANFFWDNTAKELGIGTATPGSALHVSTSAATIAQFQSTSASDIDITLIERTGGGNTTKWSLRVPSGDDEMWLRNELNQPVMKFENANGHIGIGPISPSGWQAASRLHVMDQGIALDQIIHVAGNNAGESPNLIFRRGRGSLGGETAVNSGQEIGAIWAEGHDGSAFDKNAGIRFMADVTHTGTNHASYMSFYTTPATSTTEVERMRIAANGDVTIGTGGTFDNPSANEDLYVEGNLEVDGAIYGDGSNLTGVTANAAGADGQIQYNNGGTTMSGHADLIWDDTNSRLGVGVASPQADLAVATNIDLVGNSTSRIFSDANAGREILGLRAETALADGAGINLYGDGDSSTPGIMRFYTGNTTRVYVDLNGQVGIGADANSANRLYVHHPSDLVVGHFEGGGATRVDIESAVNQDVGLRLQESGAGRWDIFNDQSDNDALVFDNTGGGNGNVIFKDPPQVIMDTEGDATFVINADNDNGAGEEDDNPRILLTQDGGTVTSAIGMVGTAGQIMAGTSANSMYINQEAASSLHFGTNNTLRMSIDSSGNVGIGSAPGTELLEVAGKVNATGLSIDGTTCLDVDTDQIFHDTDCDGTKDAGEEFIDGGGGASLWNDVSGDINYTAGNVGIGNATPDVALDVTGDIEYSGTITDVSDRRLKTDIEPLDSALDNMSRIQTYSFRMKDDEAGRFEYGVMAQELEEIYPLLVHTANDEIGSKSVNYVGLIAPMIKAQQELNTKCEMSDEQIVSLEKQVAENSRAIASLQNSDKDKDRKIDALKDEITSLKDENAQMRKELDEIKRMLRK